MSEEHNSGRSNKLLCEAREAVVIKHMESENQHDLHATVATFFRPYYEVIPTGETYDGSEAVFQFLNETYQAFPDFHFTLLALRHCDDAVIVEVNFHGTHQGNWRGLPPTYQKITYRMQNIFLFEDEKLICERLYFDSLTIMRQLGIAHDPVSAIGRITTALTHPITIFRAIVNGLSDRRKK